MSLLVVDVGTSSVRAAIVGDDARVRVERQEELLPSTPAAGLVEIDGVAIATAALRLAGAVSDEIATAGGRVRAVGVTNQRASTLVWDRVTGEPVAPGLGWQDLRTVVDCLTWQNEGLHLLPNASATKLASILNAVDPGRTRDLCFGTVDSWIVWTLTSGTVHVMDATNAGVTQLRTPTNDGWDPRVLELLRIPPNVLPAVVDSSGECGRATALPGAPPITAVVGDQQASLIGQGCVRPGQAKITFGTGGMLDVVTGASQSPPVGRNHAGTFPIVARQIDGATTWGVEAIMLAAGTNVEWLRDDLGLIATAADSHTVAAECGSTDGVVFVPALLGLGTPRWDFGARGTLLGITRGTTRAHVVRAVLEGVAHRGADLVDAAEHDTGLAIDTVRIDGGMSRNPTFVQALADATGRPVEVSRVPEATTTGAAFLAGLVTGTWPDLDAVAATWDPIARVEPARVADRELWSRAVERAEGWYPELTALEF